MLRVGLTGGIGSGKSTVAALFAELGAPIIDADIVARKIVEPGTACFQKIVAHFGNEILSLHGGLDRKTMRTLVFNNPEKKTWLENLLHPEIRAEMAAKINTVTFPYCILVIPLLTETGNNPLVDRVLVVDADEAKQIERAKARDEQSVEEIQRIIAAQSTRQFRLSKADDVITNNGSIDELKKQVTALHKKYFSNK